MQFTNPNAMKISKGTELMKWGLILTIAAGIIATILYLIGFFQASQAIIEEFERPESQDSTKKFLPTATGYIGATPFLAKFCKFCGIAFDQPGVRFCPQCGQRQI